MVVTVDNKERSRAPARSLKTIVDFAVGSHARAVAVLLAVALLGFLPGFFSIPPIDRDEARFAQATKQMVESGEYVDIRFQDEVRYKKPVGIYWLQAGVVKTASALGLPHALTTIWLYRIPSLIGATAAVLLTYWAALAFVSRRAAVLAGLMMASCVLLGVERLIAKTDAMLLMTVVAAMGAMARAYLRPGRERLDASSAWTTAAVFWTALAAGVLLKGPLIVMVVGLAAVALIVVDRSARWVLSLKPLAGIVWLAILVLPWFLAIIGRAGEAFFAESVGGAAGLARALVAGVGVGDDQAAALRAAALSRDRHPDRRRHRRARALAQALPRARDALVVRGSDGGRGCRHRRARRHRPAIRAVGVAVVGGGRGHGVLGLAALPSRRRRARLAARRRGRDPDRDRGLRRDRAVARPTVPECDARAHSARERLRASAGGGGGLSGAELGLPRRHLDPPHRYPRCRRIPARRRMPLRLHRGARGKKFCPAR